MSTTVVRASPDQDPIFDHANGTKTTVAASSTTVLTPPTNCKYVRIITDVAVFVRTDGVAAADAAGALQLTANAPEIIPVTPGTIVTAISGTSSVVRCVPLKARP